MLFAAGANATHGRQRSNEDKRCAVLKLLNDSQWRTWSDREIARHCHVSHQLVARLRRDTGRATSERKFRTKHGSVSKMDIGAIGKSKGTPGRAVQLAPLKSTPGTNETETTLNAPLSAEAAPAAASEIEEPDADNNGMVLREARAALVEFVNFMVTRGACQDGKIVITVTAEDVAELNRLADRVRSSIRRRGEPTF